VPAIVDTLHIPPARYFLTK